jgi:hypothetical protein
MCSPLGDALRRKLVCLFTFIVLLGTAGNGFADLVGYWRFDEGSGTTAYDSSSNGLDGTFEGDPAWVAGQIGYALELDGDDWVNCDTPPELVLTGDISITCWVNPAAFVGRQAFAGLDTGYVFKVHEGGILCFTTPGVLDMPSAVSILEAGTWQHVAVTFQPGQEVVYYINGIETDRFAGAAINTGTGPFRIGSNQWSENLVGLIDEVRIYDHILTESEVLAAMEGTKGYPYALGPSPADGVLYADTWVSLRWKAGDFAVSHDVYIADNFDDVNDATRDSETFRSNTTYTYFVAGFPGYPYPDGLVPGTTYYWRIDEVNDAEPNSPWKGNIWGFTVPPRKAYNPVPGDGIKFLPADDTTLTWTAGLGAKLHYVYFGDDFDTVANATGATQQVFTNYPTGPLELDKTYYWRVDESDGIVTYPGDVWSFSTRPEIPVTDPNLLAWWKLDEGMGNIVLDWSGHGNHGTLANGPVWVPGNDGSALQFDGRDDYVNLGTPAGLYIPDNYTYTAWFRVGKDINGDSDAQYILCIGSRSDLCFGIEDNVGVDGDLALHYYDTAPGFHSLGVGKTSWSAGDWHMVAGTKDSATGHKIYLDGELRNSDTNTNDDNYATDRMISIGAMGWNNDEYYNGAIDDVRIYNRTLSQQEIQDVMRGDLLIAWKPTPANGAMVSIDEALPLSFSPGDMASQHDVYFGTDRDAVDDADTSTADIYRGRQNGTSYTPPEGVEWGGGPYYWRIDEYNTDGSISKGRIWSFAVADYLLVDDFESYDAGDNQIWYSWHDGLGYGAVGTANYYPGNGTGSAVGDETTDSYTEETIVHGGGQSMPVVYDNNKQDYAKYSEVEMTLTNPRDWTKDGVAELSLWFRGYPASVGSFVEGPVGTYTMTGSGTDIWDVTGIGTGYHDEFHFAYKMLAGAGSITARVDSVENTNAWAKAGVMIRETLDADSVHAMTVVTPAQGIAFQRRNVTGDTSASDATTGLAAPYWVKIARDLSGNFTASCSADGSNWQMIGTSDNISMSSNVYIGLAVTSTNAALTCQAVFSNVTTTGNVTGQWADQDIGIASNDAELLYVALSNSNGTSAAVTHTDPAAAQIDTWTQWAVPLSAFADQGVDLTDVDKIAIGLGTRGNMTVPGGSGKMYFDDIRLYRSTEVAE